MRAILLVIPTTAYESNTSTPLPVGLVWGERSLFISAFKMMGTGKIAENDSRQENGGRAPCLKKEVEIHK